MHFEQKFRSKYSEKRYTHTVDELIAMSKRIFHGLDFKEMDAYTNHEQDQILNDLDDYVSAVLDPALDQVMRGLMFTKMALLPMLLMMQLY